MGSDSERNNLGLLIVDCYSLTTDAAQVQISNTPSLKSAVCIPDIRVFLISQFPS